MEKRLTEQEQIKKMPNPRKKKIEILSDREIDRVEGLINAIEAAGVSEFIEYIRSPWKMLWPNFVAGVARGFGALVGVALVLAGIGWILAITIDIPLIGKTLEPYVMRAQAEINRYIDQTNYSDEFQSMSDTLKSIEKNTSPKQ